MTILNSRNFALALALGLAATSAQAEPVRSVAGEPAWAPKAVPAPTWRLAQVPAGSATRIDLPALELLRVAEVQKRNARRDNIATQIGLNRAVEASAQAKLMRLRWTPVPGGSVARLEVDSPDALGLRAGLKLASLPDGVELRFAGSLAPERVLLVPAEEAKRLANDGLYWTPVTDGGTQLIEVFAPAGVDTGAIRLQLPQVSHLLTNSQEQFSLAKAIGDSGSCNVDTVCRVNTLGQNFVNAKNSVARMTFSDGVGTFTCTGTLLNDTDTNTQIPYFYSADHCISNQTMANTLNTFWGFEATTCGGLTAAANTVLAGGATYLYSEDGSTGTDGLLLRLNGTPPAGAYFAGWDANQVTDGTEVLAIHHPAGDLKMSSIGQKISQDTVNIEVGWTSGTTEGGSSGSGLFTNSGSGYALRGGLYGGFASCANTGDLNNTNNRDFYSRLDVMYPNIAQYLAPGGGGTDPGPSHDYSGAWYVPAESGWGLTALQYNGGETLFVLFFIYDSAGRGQWYELGGGWSANDVRSGDMLQSTANQPWGSTFGGRNFSVAGTGSLTFTSATSANLTFTVNGVTRTVALSKL